MWADTLFRAEQQHALRLLAWAVGSIVTGTALYAVLAMKRSTAPLLRQFALQMLGWGIVCAVLGVNAWRAAVLRDFAGASRLERWLWLAISFEIGLLAIGISIAAAAWLTGRRYGGVGAGIAIIVQALALLVLDLNFMSMFAR